MLNVHRETAQDAAIDRAAGFLLEQADTEFAEVRHEMMFPHAAGFSGPSERQSSDVFARAVLGGILADLSDLERDARRSQELRRIARREANYIAGRKLQRCEGGWSYFPDLPELPPDVDSLAAALSLFARIAPDHLDLCNRPIDIVLAGAQSDGSFETWIMTPTDEAALRARMQWDVRFCWGAGPDVDVMAHFYHALSLADPIRYAASINRGAAALVRAQEPNGTWKSTWYVGPAYGACLCLQLLRAADVGQEAVAKAHAALRETQRSDGAWGTTTTRPLAMETALSMWALRSEADEGDAERVNLGAAALVDMQSPDGSWELSPWICMPIGRATGNVRRIATYQSVTITTAFCLRALLAARPGSDVSAPAQSWRS